MSPLPLPSTFSGLLDPSSPANRSLVFDRGMDPAGEKEAFLQGFCGEYRQDRRGHFDHFVARRSAALESAGAKAIDMTTHARLVIGLGLPHPIETGFLFDRLSGSVYLPGSSVKGMMRAAARLIGAEIIGAEDGAARFGNEHLLTGPEPVSERVALAHVAVERIGFAGADHRFDNRPDRGGIGLCGGPDDH